MSTTTSCPIHGLIQLSTEEEEILALPIVRRLETIRQTGMVMAAAPGALHSRLEHCIGAMYLAGLAYDAVVSRHHYHADFSSYWRRILRLAALLHDLGHTPFSHSLEDLFEEGYDHEKMTRELILSSIQCLSMDDRRAVAKIASGPSSGLDTYSNWERFLSHLITGPVGVDRLDYVSRDSVYLRFRSGIELKEISELRLIADGGTRDRSAWLDENTDCVLALPPGVTLDKRVGLARERIILSYIYDPRVRVQEYHLKTFLKMEMFQIPIDPEKFARLDEQEILSKLGSSSIPDAQRICGGMPPYVNVFNRRRGNQDIYSWKNELQDRLGERVTLVLDVHEKEKSKLLPTWDGKSLLTKDELWGASLMLQLVLADASKLSSIPILF